MILCSIMPGFYRGGILRLHQDVSSITWRGASDSPRKGFYSGVLVMRHYLQKGNTTQTGTLLLPSQLWSSSLVTPDLVPRGSQGLLVRFLPKDPGNLTMLNE